MPITAADLIKNRPFPVTTSMDAALLDALNLMQRHNFSQLPIVSIDKKQQGMVTSESILRTQKKLSAPLEKLKVQHAATNAAKSAPDDNIFDVIENFNKYPAVLVVDNEDHLMGVITPWDAASHLQQRTEDLMLVEDIESAIKDHIRAAYTDMATGLLVDTQLSAAIAHMVDRSQQTERDVRSALQKYLTKANINHSPDTELVKDAFSKFIASKKEPTAFKDLTLSQYIELLVRGERWKTYGQTFSLDAEYLHNLLDNVREIRNQLMHFRSEITDDQRETLRYCRDLFERHPAPEFTPAVLTPMISTVTDVLLDVEPTQDELAPGESRYARLGLHLQNLPRKTEKVDITFDEIETILEGDLPPSAWQHRSWWANDSVSRTQSQQWLEAGWRVIRVSLSEKRVTFHRSEDRNQQYIRFFSAVISDLRKSGAFALRDVNPIGVNWINVATLPRTGKQHPASLTFAFTRGNRFRVELYIDTGDGGKNKRIFDLLYQQRDAIEHDLGEKLDWEKLISKRASRIALYANGSIDDSDEHLAELCAWGVDRMVRFERAISARADKAILTVL